MALNPVVSIPPIKVGLDLDGTTCDFIEAFAEVISHILNVPHESLTRTPSDYSMPEWNLGKDLFKYWHIGASDHGLLRNIEPYPHAINVINRLTENNIAEFHIVTARPSKDGDCMVKEDTVAWLEDHGLKHSALHFISEKGALEMDVFIDDNPNEIRHIQESGQQIIAYNHFYNKDIENVVRAHGWLDIEEILINAYYSNKLSANGGALIKGIKGTTCAACLSESEIKAKSAGFKAFGEEMRSSGISRVYSALSGARVAIQHKLREEGAYADEERVEQLMNDMLDSMNITLNYYEGSDNLTTFIKGNAH